MEPVLRTVTRTQGNNAAITSGAIRPEGFSLAFEDVPVLISAFRRMVRETAYDLCEMAFTTYLCAKEHGKRFTALPIFLVRGFHHGAIIYRPGSGIRGPADLAGRRVGVSRGYTVTTGVWARAILQTEYGLDLDSVTWVCSGDEHVAEYRPPANVVPMTGNGTLADRLIDGELAAAIGIPPDRPGLAPLIPDPEEAGYAALRDRGLYPINHLMVVRDELLAEHPTLARAVTRAFTQAKDGYVRRLAGRSAGAGDRTDARYRRVLAETGADPLPYTVDGNLPMIQSLIDHAVDQHILTRRPAVPELFAVTGD